MQKNTLHISSGIAQICYYILSTIRLCIDSKSLDFKSEKLRLLVESKSQNHFKFMSHIYFKTEPYGQQVQRGWNEMHLK